MATLVLRIPKGSPLTYAEADANWFNINAELAAVSGIASTALQPGTDIPTSDVTGLDAALAGKQPLATVLTNTTAAFTTSQETKLAGIASGAQVNAPTDLAYTSASRLLASSTGADVTLPLVGVDAGLMTAADKTKLDGIASGAQVNVPTNLSYTAASRVIASDTGTDATLPLVTSGDAGLAPASGGGTTNFLRADGTWATPAGGGAGGPTLGKVIAVSLSGRL